MNIEQTKESFIRQYETYVEANGDLDEYSLYLASSTVMVGYFLKVHSKNPQKAVRRYLNDHSVSSTKANEVRTLINILNP